MMVDVLVIGAGLAGLTAAWQAAAQGKRVHVLAKGWGATHWHAGCVDVLGYLVPSQTIPCDSPAAALGEFVDANPGHPYASLGVPGIEEALHALQALCQDAGYPLRGSLSRNWLLPSGVGAFRPTCLAPATMIAGDLRQADSALIVGFRGFEDFSAALVAANLADQGVPARSVQLDLPGLRQRRLLNPITLGALLDRPDFRAEVGQALRSEVGDAKRVGFPAVFGLKDAVAQLAELEEQIGRPLFEIPTLPPSLPGMRLHRLLVNAIQHHGGQISDGMAVIGCDTRQGRITAVYTESAARKRRHQAKVYIVATGGILGGGIVGERDGRLSETALGLPLQLPAGRAAWFSRDYFDGQGHPVFRTGITVDDRFRPLDTSGEVLYENLLAAGNGLAFHDALRERSLEGVAVASGYWVGKKAAEDATS